MDSKVLYCPTSANFFKDIQLTNNQNSYYILVSRLEEHKNLEHVFDTFSLLDQKLIVLGTGTLLKRYCEEFPKISFKGYVNDKARRS